MENNKKQSFSKTIEKNGKSKTIRVRQVENGWVVTIEKHSDDKWESKEYISSTNPFEGGDKISPDEKMMTEARFGDFLDL